MGKTISSKLHGKFKSVYWILIVLIGKSYFHYLPIGQSVYNGNEILCRISNSC